MASATIFSYSLLDALGTVTEVSVFTKYNGAVETTNALGGAWAEVGGEIDALTTSQIIGGHIEIPAVADGGWKSAPAAGNNNGEVVVVAVKNTGSKYSTEVLLPGYIDALIVSGRVDLTNTDLVALTDRLAGTGGTVQYTTNTGVQLTTVAKAFLTKRKVRNLRLKTESRPA